MWQFDVGSVRTTIVAMRGAGTQTHSAAAAAARAAGQVLLGILRNNISARDHSLRQLAQMGHPYARRHGSIQIHTGANPYLTNPTSLVHQQSGRLMSSAFVAESTGTGGTSIRVGLDKSIAPHAVYVTQGTRVMLARDVVTETRDADGTREAIMRTVVKVLGKQYRSQAGVKFSRAGWHP